jgi:inhibitor of KinA
MHNFNAIPFHCYSLSEGAITVEFGVKISDHLLAAVTNFNDLLLQSPFPGFISTIPAYATLTLFYDPMITVYSSLTGIDCFEKVSGYITRLMINLKNADAKAGNMITIPVCYGGAYGPDLAAIASERKISVDNIVHLHSNCVYKVFMIGFLPGFAYLGGMAPQLAMPRKTTPRKVVPAGAVGIAGQQTGVYPLESPGGWQLIGQTPVNLFNIKNSPPALLKAGDRVIFKPISVDEFKELAG